MKRHSVNGRPHYLLVTRTGPSRLSGEWSFSIQTPDGVEQFRAHDVEPDVVGERLELLPVVRGLEALDEPARVTVLSSSRYVNQGLANGLEEWRSNDWCWEYFGRMVPIKNRDLWQRVDRAGRIHRIAHRRWRFDAPHQFGASGHRPMRTCGARRPSQGHSRRQPATGVSGELAALFGKAAHALIGRSPRQESLSRAYGRAPG